jgi:hypothetical protein
MLEKRLDYDTSRETWVKRLLSSGAIAHSEFLRRRGREILWWHPVPDSTNP